MACSFKEIGTLVALCGGISLSPPARAQEPTEPDWLATIVNEYGQHCGKHAERVNGRQLLIACGAAGVWEVSLDDAGPRFVQSYPFSGDVIGFVVEPDGRLWVELQLLEARPFVPRTPQGAGVFPEPKTPPAPAAPSAAAALAPLPDPALVVPTPATSARDKAQGHVTRSRAGEVVVSLGTMDGIARSDRIELSLTPADAPSGEDPELSRETLAIGVVTDVSEHSARVLLGINEAVPVGALATSTKAQTTASLSAPPRFSGLWDLTLLARPFAPLDELGGGALLSGSLGYRFSKLHLQAVLDPLAFGDVQGKDAIGVVNAAVIASYDSQYFEMGLGFGAQTVNESGFVLDPGSGIAAMQVIRLGALDGLNLSARTNIVLFHSQFQFGALVATGQIPVTRGYWLLLSGGGGEVGYGYGELGLRVLLAGNGLAGSKFLTVSAGGAAVFRSNPCTEFSCGDSTFGGPMAGIGGEWRF